MRFSNSKVLAIFVMALVLAGALGAFFYTYKIGERTIEVEVESGDYDYGSDYDYDKLTLDSCENRRRRPMAVMIAEDAEARPLSGIGMADIVIEMPVVTGSITRMMAIFICENPKEIGSVRSARHDFIPLALGFDAIFAHWGGSYFALDELKKGVIDNLDAFPNYYDTFYRKPSVPAPHNGFTSMASMINAAQMLGYRMTSEFEGYGVAKSQNTPNQSSSVPEQSSVRGTAPSSDGTGRAGTKAQTIEVEYKYPYNVRYEYDSQRNAYLRWRGGEKEVDALGGEQVETSNVVLMEAKSRQIDRDYNDVDVLGSGEAAVYMNGEEIRGAWRKKRAEDVLRFFDNNDEEIKFVPGSIWINVAEPSTIVNLKF